MCLASEVLRISVECKYVFLLVYTHPIKKVDIGTKPHGDEVTAYSICDSKSFSKMLNVCSARALGCGVAEIAT